MRHAISVILTYATTNDRCGHEHVNFCINVKQNCNTKSSLQCRLIVFFSALWMRICFRKTFWLFCCWFGNKQLTILSTRTKGSNAKICRLYLQMHSILKRVHHLTHLVLCAYFIGFCCIFSDISIEKRVDYVCSILKWKLFQIKQSQS